MPNDLLPLQPKNLRPDAAHSPGKVRAHLHAAHFPGTGPAGRKCGSCLFMTDKSKCLLWFNMIKRALRGRKPPFWNKIPLETAACRYYQPKGTRHGNP